MRGKDRIFKIGAIQHIYQNTLDGWLIFYSKRDYLVLFSLISVAVRKYGIQIIGLCMMPDHIHILVRAENLQTLSQFVCYYSSLFARANNKTTFRRGQLFRHSFGSAMKPDDKRCRSVIAYVYNNLVEKRLADDVESGQWNFLRYARQPYPFSEKLELAGASRAMRRAVEEIKGDRKTDIPLNYNQIERICKDLNRTETAQLTDFIIQQYNCIDYEAAFSFFGSYDSFVTSCNAFTGSEYGVGEIHHKASDIIYGRITDLLRRKYAFHDIKDVFRLEEDKRKKLALAIAKETGAPLFQIAKYFHCSTLERDG